LGDAEPVGNAERHADVGADVEELVLDALEDRPHLRGRVAGEHQPDE
jgi:hypothetical protein